ncbi:hypothetical protein BU26DRAFT_518104 [Trematosphaeria pertusa]|uniref:Uncharacterized protein n=1 Tax=Trematosphaeria pertusa TaxID=390896 RepID=A0A6A6IPC8_9PLEO|nr:uncharacterized protein BU26DRAFT_518104 [Trematosphaeria pertusa]KAF2251450.1 hypothetical protein BU26DRAFT_518104 [Trematosphaeria pertusa]
MICAATSFYVRCSYKRPCIVWALPDEREVATLERQVIAANEEARLEAERKQAAALDPTTPEYRELTAFNEEIDKYNRDFKSRHPGHKGMKGLKKRRSPKQFFKHEIFTYNVDGKGMDAIWFAEQILKKQLFPYYC